MRSVIYFVRTNERALRMKVPQGCHVRAQRQKKIGAKAISEVFFSIAFILWNNPGLTNLRRLSHAVFTSYADPGLKMREHICFSLF
jgi:hypothetical protein